MKRALFVRYLLAGLLGAAAAAIVLQYRGRVSAAPFLLRVLLAAGAVLLICALLAYLGSDSFTKPLSGLNAAMERHGEQMSFSALPDSIYPEMARLRENIRKLCGKIIASRKKLKQQQEHFDFLIDNLDEGLLITDLSGTISGLNRKAAAVLRLGQEAVQQNLADVLAEEAILDAFQKAVSQNLITRFDLKAADGATYALTARLIREEAGEAVMRRQEFVVITLTDVTAERSALQQRQDFFSNASHELKTPITSILGFAELLEAGVITDAGKLAESASIIRREASRMNRIISDLLMIASLENEGEAGERSTVQLSEVISEIGDSLRVAMAEKGVTMEVSGGNFSVRMAYSHIHNLLGNLIQNAVKYNKEGGKVWVRAELDGERLHLTVKDTGIGIPAELKCRVFERFFRVDKGRSRSVGGTGLGLSIVKHIVTLYGGEITLDSTLGEGTTIQVLL